MIDHVLTFPDRAAALTALGGLGLAAEDADGVLHFDAAKVVEVRLITAVGALDTSDPESTIALPDETLPGCHVVVALPAMDAALVALPGDVCRVVADREAAAVGDPAFVKYMAADVNAEVLAGVTVSPAFAGSAYPFGNIPT